MVKCTGRGLVVKQPGVLSKVQMLNLALGVGVLFPSSKHGGVPKNWFTGLNGALEFWERDATKQKSVKRTAFSPESVPGIQCMKALVMNSAGKAIQ